MRDVRVDVDQSERRTSHVRFFYVKHAARLILLDGQILLRYRSRLVCRERNLRATQNSRAERSYEVSAIH